MEKIQNFNEEGIAQKKGLSEGEKAALLKGILNKKVKQDKASSVNKNKLDLIIDVDISRLYEAMSIFFNGMANVFNQFANNMNVAANNFKDEAIRILREKDNNKNDNN